MSLSGLILKWIGWKVDISAPQRDKCVICVAPHTSNWDFILGLMAYKSLGKKANFLMKSSWFFFPLKYFFKAMGGIPVERGRNKNLTKQLVEDFSKSTYMNLAVTPEGTRSGVTEWHTGFLRIAHAAGVPVQLGVIDFLHKRIIISEEFFPTPDIDSVLLVVKNYYRSYGNCARHPRNFTL